MAKYSFEWDMQIDVCELYGDLIKWYFNLHAWYENIVENYVRIE